MKVTQVVFCQLAIMDVWESAYLARPGRAGRPLASPGYFLHETERRPRRQAFLGLDSANSGRAGRGPGLGQARRWHACRGENKLGATGYPFTPHALMSWQCRCGY